MQRRSAVSRRALLSTAAGCFGGGLLLDAWLFDSAAAESGTSTWHQRWGDGTQRKFTPVAPDPSSVTDSWSATVEEPRGKITVECVGAERVYVCDYNRVLAYDRNDGSRAWTYKAQEGSFARPTLVDDTVVVQENGTVHAIAIESGEARWKGSFSAPAQPFANPTTRNGSVYLRAGTTYTAVQPTTGFQSESLDAEPFGTLLAATDTQLFWWVDGTFQATDTEGTLGWRQTFGRSFPPSSKTIAVTDEHVVLRRFSTGNTPLVTALDRESGQQVWQVSDATAESVALCGGRETVYLGSGTRLYALDAATGDRVWDLQTDAVRPAPVVTLETVYVPLDDGITPVDPESGDQQAETLLDGRTTSSLAAVDDGVYATADNQLFALEEP